MTYPYLDYSGRDDVLTGGVKMIPIETPKGTFNVWTKRIGNSPTRKVLLLHGGPGMTHECFEAFDSYFPAAEIEYYYYDQLGSFYSDQPDEPDLWEVTRFVEEVEQVRQALHLDAGAFYLYGHSWGAMLALEYALAYQQHLKGLILSNGTSSIPDYNAYQASTLHPQMDPEVLDELQRLEVAGDFGNPRYFSLLVPNINEKHGLRMPFAAWPEPIRRSLGHSNPAIHGRMLGTSALSLGGQLEDWDRSGDLGRIAVPTLTVGATYDTMDPAHMKAMAGQVQRGRYLHCPNGSHLVFYDDPEPYFEGLVRFIEDVDAGRF